jgi:hypothetical protein
VAKRKKQQPWDAVFERIRVRSNPGDLYVRLPTDAELDALESEIGSRLPGSYRVFMKRFGPGELYGEIRFSQITPVRKGLHTVGQRTLELRDLHQNDRLYRTAPNAQWLSSLVYFGSSYHGDEYSWDPAEVTRSDPHECRIYQLRRMQEDHPIAAGGSFAKFAEWVVADTHRWLDQESIALMGPGIRFDRLYQRAKKAPLKRDVKRWLAWNGGTVLALARSIQDGGQLDALPVLADALEEAGCSNADMLDSCRKGIPDVDGKWVVQVLLGKE